MRERATLSAAPSTFGLLDLALTTTRAAKRTVKRLAVSTHGNVAIIFALSLIPILFAGGVAVDLSRALMVRERLGHTLDAAALAAGSKPGLTEEERQDLVDAFVKANYPEKKLGVPGKISVETTDLGLTASATADVPTAILGMFGYGEITVAANVEVVRELKGLEVVMVLDNTGSMSGSKIKSLRSAATKLIGILFEEDENPELLRVGLVPFAAAVNIGTDSLANGWIDEDAESSIAGENFQPGVTNVLDLYDQIKNRSWNGCVEERVPPYDLSDDAPTSSNPDTLWVPYFAPDEPDSGGTYDNKYLKDGVTGSVDKRQRNVKKYNKASVSSSTYGPLYGCTTTEITPLTNDKNALENAISAMGADGYTHIPLGIAWGRRVISPGEPYTEGADYDDPEWRKAVVILTDGENTIDSMSNHNKSNYSAYGYLAEGRLGTTSASTFESKLDSKTSEICEELKDDNIEVYTITFDVDSKSLQNLFRDCATTPANYFDSPSGSELEAAFEAIANALSNLRLSR